MKVVIRTDASIEIGSGHVMRCVTLAKQLKRHNLHVTFICRELEGNYIQFLKEEKMNVIPLPCLDESHSIEVNFKKDADETINIIREMDTIDLLIVDHYDIEREWETTLRPYVKKIMVIDDLANRPHDCDLLLDQNYYANMNERYQHLIPPHCTTMLGPDYVLLRDEFLKIKPKERTGEVENIFIFFGGSDPAGETIKALRAIENIKPLNVKVDVVVGASNPKRDEIKMICEKMPYVAFHCQINNMAEMMQKADLAIGAGGAITWERCALGLPSITITIANNQIETTTLLHELGATFYLGKSEEVSSELLEQNVAKLLNDREKVKQLAKKSAQIVNLNKVKELPVTKTILTMIGALS